MPKGKTKTSKKNKVKVHSKQRKLTKGKPRTSVLNKLTNQSTRQSLMTLFKRAIESTHNKTKSETNLASRLLDTPNSKVSVKGFSKSIQSAYSSVTTNNKTVEQGQTIINDSRKPFIEIAKLQNGKIEKYQIRRGTQL